MANWKQVNGYNNIYVSDEGDLKRVYKSGKEHFYKHSVTKKGYIRIHLCVNKESQHYMLHRLVGEAFVDNPENKPFINHKNGNKKDNRACNLEWCTQNENIQHARKNSMLWSKIEPKDVHQIRSIYSQGWFTHKEIADAYNLARSVVTRIINKKRWKHI